MKYFLGLIPGEDDYKHLQIIRSKIEEKFLIRDYRINPVFHNTISHFESNSFNDLFVNLNLTLSKIKSQKITLDVIRLEIWDNGKLALILNNTSLYSLIDKIEFAHDKYCINQSYRESMRKEFGIIKESLGDHIKIIRNINLEDKTKILHLNVLNQINTITFEKQALFNADYSEFRYFDQ